MDKKIDHYAVMGNPVQHSKSPWIHAEFAKQTGESLQYTAIEVPKDAFPQAVTSFQEDGGKGLNITLPFKQQAFDLVSESSERAKRAQAVNTIVFHEDGQTFGDNTDGVGLTRDIMQNHHGTLQQKRILLIGAGGAARGVLGPLLDEYPDKIVIVNRTVAKGVALAEAFSQFGPVSGCGFEDLSGHAFDIIINATSCSLHDEVPPLPNEILAPDCLCYDMVYAKEPTVFLRWAKKQGAKKCIDGMGMLVEQAAESFYLWRGVCPNTAPVIQQLT